MIAYRTHGIRNGAFVGHAREEDHAERGVALPRGWLTTPAALSRAPLPPTMTHLERHAPAPAHIQEQLVTDRKT